MLNTIIVLVLIAAVLWGVYSLWQKDRKSTRLNSSHLGISYAVFCLKKTSERAQITLRLRHLTARE